MQTSSENLQKMTVPARKSRESRWQDIAVVDLNGDILTLVYTHRGYNIRIISEKHPGRSGECMTISGKTSRTDWDRVRKSIEMDEPIPYDANDRDDGPYDPNDDAAVEAYWKQATIWQGWPRPVLIQKDGVPVHPDGTPRIEQPKSEAAEADASKTRAKAS